MFLSIIPSHPPTPVASSDELFLFFGSTVPSPSFPLPLFLSHYSCIQDEFSPAREGWEYTALIFLFYKYPPPLFSPMGDSSEVPPPGSPGCCLRSTAHRRSYARENSIRRGSFFIYLGGFHSQPRTVGCFRDFVIHQVHEHVPPFQLPPSFFFSQNWARA